MPPVLLTQILIAGALLGVMSVVDTLSYGVRTAGVLTKRLAISLAIFNILVIFSRLSNMIQAPVIGNLPDKVARGEYTAVQVLDGLRLALLFIIAGVIIGALLMRTWLQLSRRGIALMEQRGSLPLAVAYGLTHAWELPRYVRGPIPPSLHRYLDPRRIPYAFLLWNILVTCFYSIGVMSTILAASWDHSVASTAILLSGIVNGIATFLLFTIVDPPAAVVVDQCINGKRPVDDAKVMNLYLVVTRLLGCLLAWVLLPVMGHYVLAAAHGVDRLFSAKEQDAIVGTAFAQCGDLKHTFVVYGQTATLRFELTVENTGDEAVTLEYASGAKFDFALRHGETEVWRYTNEFRFTQAMLSEELPPGAAVKFDYSWQPADAAGKPPLITGAYHFEARHLARTQPVVLGFDGELK